MSDIHPEDQAKLAALISDLELSDSTTIIFALAPKSAPKHPVVVEFKSQLAKSHADFDCTNFFYSDASLIQFLYSFNQSSSIIDQSTGINGVKRKVLMAFGIEQLPTHRIVRELRQLNLGRDALFERDLILVFWLNKAEFMNEFRDRAPDFWDWRGKLVEFQTRPSIDPLLYPYLEWLIAENSYLKVGGIMQVQRQVDVFLDQVYVSLSGESHKQVSKTSPTEAPFSYINRNDFPSQDSLELDLEIFIPTPGETKTVTQKVDLAQAVRESKYSVILGDPGAGKSTLLRYLALNFAQAYRNEQETVIAGEERENLGQTLLPIFFRVADYAEKLGKEPNLSLWDFLSRFYRQWEVHLTNQQQEQPETEMALLLDENMRLGRCLILLDGLDEVFDQNSRQVIVERIEEFVNTFSSNKFLVTSRIAGYRDVNLSERFNHFTIIDMDQERVEKFLNRWCFAIEKAQQPEAEAGNQQRNVHEQVTNLLEAINNNEGVKSLTGNPLLLTILALIHRNGERLPNRRVRVYELAVQTLIADWQLSKKLPGATHMLLKESEVLELLAPLAYWMHEEKPSGLVNQAEVETKLAQLYEEDTTSATVEQTVAEFLRRVRETTGLFVERAPSVYGFMHLTFEEYFAARYIADNEVRDILAIIQRHRHEPRWNEPILLTLGYLSDSPKRIKRLIKQLFQNLETYQPAINKGEISLKNLASREPILVFPVINEEGEIKFTESATVWIDLIFAAQILAEVEVDNRTRMKLIEKLVFTLLATDEEFDEEPIQKLLKLLRQIETFNQKGEVINCLQKAAINNSFTEDIKVRAKTVILYVACSEPGETLLKYGTQIVNDLEPTLFCAIKGLVTEVGEDMTSALEVSSKTDGNHSELIFLTGLSYIRSDNYQQAITILEKTRESLSSSLKPYLNWALAICYQESDQLYKAIDYYQECFEKLASCIEPHALIVFWINLGVCHRLHKQYQKSLDCFQQYLSIAREVEKTRDESFYLFHIGKTYQAWGKYQQAINYYQQSRDLYQQLSRDNNVANQWYWLGYCYREWGKYEPAIECQQQCLAIRQKLDNPAAISSAYFQLGRIYQAWDKYQQAIDCYQQSLEIEQQLGRDNSVAIMWFVLGDCYREWEKYEQALECLQQCLAIHQKLDNPVYISSAYYQLGRIYQGWDKYQKAIDCYQQSLEIKQQLGRDKSIASMWYWLGDCYREWGKYEQAIECQQQCLAIRQKLDIPAAISSAYYQLGRIYQAWGKYQQAIDCYQQSLEIKQQLGRDKNIANQWYWLGVCYREWGKYEQALECQQQCLEIRQKLDNPVYISSAYYQLGRIYQAWENHEEAINYHQQSRDLYQQLGRDKNIANQWYWLGVCYQDWGKYEQAIECQQQCLEIRQKLDNSEDISFAYFQLGRIYQAWENHEEAINYYQQSYQGYQKLDQQKNMARSQRIIAINQGFIAKNHPNKTEALNFLSQAEENLNQAIKINIQGEYKGNLAYDYIALALLHSEYLRLQPNHQIQAHINQFEQNYTTGFTYFTELGETVSLAEKSLDIAMAYLEINPLKNLNRAEEIAQKSLQVFQEYNRSKLEAKAQELLDKIAEN